MNMDIRGQPICAPAAFWPAVMEPVWAKLLDGSFRKFWHGQTRFSISRAKVAPRAVPAKNSQVSQWGDDHALVLIVLGGIASLRILAE